MPDWNKALQRLDESRWLLPESYKAGMRVNGIIYANDTLMQAIAQEEAIEQVANVACLPGIIKSSFAMPDIHWGYGFPVGGVAGTSLPNGVISPGGIGFDINCGMRLLRTNLSYSEVKDKIVTLIDKMFTLIPCGVGESGGIKIEEKEFSKVLREGAAWAVKRGYGWQKDLEVTESQGRLDDANPDAVTKAAIKRGLPQLGTLGSGNHFIEVQRVAEIFNPEAAQAFGLFKDQIVIMIHTGSRGFGHQVCTDFLSVMAQALNKYGISVPDRQLACAPLDSKEGEDYFAAMCCAANYAWANRQCLAHWVREGFEQIFRLSAEKLGMEQIYDVAHNIAKIESYEVDNKRLKICVHRKGATRAFPAHHPELPAQYQAVGQPVLVPGDMGRSSYILVGTKKAMQECFASTCHGAGRRMSRSAAKKAVRGRDLAQRLREQGIYVRAKELITLAEEAPEAYKDVDMVVEVAHTAGLSQKVAKLKPLGVMKG
jgi:tRNA-splicing ligase RtcB